YCPVCREAVVLSIYRYVDPIDGCKPAASGHLFTAQEPAGIALDLLKPKTHGLEGKFWLFPGGSEPESPSSTRADRTQPGPPPKIAAAPAFAQGNAGKNVKWTIPVRGMKPGDYVVVCRVRDDTKVDRDVLPWVIKDERGVLESERRWILTVQ